MKFEIITTKDVLYDKCENVEQLYDNFYLPLLVEFKELKKQLEYLRSGEYLNQLKFERNMLEDIVQNMEVSKEDKEFIDMTHRNTELLEENQQLKEKLNCDLQWAFKYDELFEENKRLKSVINEVKEYIKSEKQDYCPYELNDYKVREILEILDKAKGSNKE